MKEIIKMKKILLLIYLTTLFLQGFSQKEMNPFNDSLARYEKIMIGLGDSLIDGSNEWVRMDALTDFIPIFKHTLKFPGSYNYPFDSLSFMHKLTAPDNKFKIYSWVLKFDNRTFRYYGAIQFNDPEKLKLIPLFDKSSSIPWDMEEDTILDNESWFGCLYYEIGMTQKGKKTYYILLGWDGNNSIGNKKIVEILSFDNEGKPIFGAPIIKMDKSRVLNRKVFQYNSSAVFSLKFISGTNKIVFDNLIPPDEKNLGKLWSYIPDGSYNYFDVKKGKLIFKKDFFNPKSKPSDEINIKPALKP
jgi:hypothetical protein